MPNRYIKQLKQFWNKTRITAKARFIGPCLRAFLSNLGNGFLQATKCWHSVHLSPRLRPCLFRLSCKCKKATAKTTNDSAKMKPTSGVSYFPSTNLSLYHWRKLVQWERCVKHCLNTWKASNPWRSNTQTEDVRRLCGSVKKLEIDQVQSRPAQELQEFSFARVSHFYLCIGILPINLFQHICSPWRDVKSLLKLKNICSSTAFFKI